MSILEPSPEEQRRILEHVAGFIVDHAAGIARLPVAVRADRDAIRRQLDAVGVETATDAGVVIDRVVALLTDGMVHTGHPRYFGLFNPAPSFMGIVAELIVAAFNPQLAAWSHAPAAVEMEAWTIDYLAGRCGLDGPVGGSFTSGGAEANASALHLALTRAIPDMATAGLAAAGVRPTLYASSESHLAWLKIAHVSGVGRDAVRLVPTDARMRMDPDALRRLMAEDTAAGHRPVLIVGTAGTTSAGVVDPLTELAGIAADYGCLFHVDAAWAGAAVLSDRLRPHLAGIERADSVTIDPHKWMSVPMGAGAFITAHPGLLAESYRVETSYMPDRVEATVDPYTHSIQWSRRFAGLKVFLTLATVGREGYSAQLEHDTRLGDRLREGLVATGWSVRNHTPLPVVCFADPYRLGDDEHHRRIAADVVESAAAWLSTTVIGGEPCLRACICSHRTTDGDVDALVIRLAAARTG